MGFTASDSAQLKFFVEFPFPRQKSTSYSYVIDLFLEDGVSSNRRAPP